MNKQKKRWILCMYSGGLDSTGVVYSLLTKPEYKDYNIHVHTMTLHNIEERGGAEYQATMKCKKWFSDNCREFKFTRSSHDYRFMGENFIWDMDICAFFAAQTTRCTFDDYAHIAMGRTATDLETVHANFHARMERAQAIVDAVYYVEKFKERPEYIFPVVEMTKKEIWDMLPEELRENTWSCRFPQRDEKSNYVICGQCPTCIERANVQV